MRTGRSIGPPGDNGETEFLIEEGAYIRNMNYVVRSWMCRFPMLIMHLLYCFDCILSRGRRRRRRRRKVRRRSGGVLIQRQRRLGHPRRRHHHRRRKSRNREPRVRRRGHHLRKRRPRGNVRRRRGHPSPPPSQCLIQRNWQRFSARSSPTKDTTLLAPRAQGWSPPWSPPLSPRSRLRRRRSLSHRGHWLLLRPPVRGSEYLCISIRV